MSVCPVSIVMAEIKRRNRIRLKHLQRLVRAFENPHEDFLTVADALGINRSTARNIEARYVREGRVEEIPRGGSNNVQIDG